MKGGQYIVIPPGVSNDLQKLVHKKIIGLTIKAPSNPKAKKIISE